jgi:hypothetical protein
MLVGAKGTEDSVIAVQVCALVPQAPVADTHTFPEEPPMVTEIEVVPCPELITAPAGTVQV